VVALLKRDRLFSISTLRYVLRETGNRRPGIEGTDELTSNHHPNGVNVGTANGDYFAWEVEGTRRSNYQSKYGILIALTEW
jgi:hypothetical protein